MVPLEQTANRYKDSFLSPETGPKLSPENAIWHSRTGWGGPANCQTYDTG